VRAEFRARARLLYDEQIKDMVDIFSERDAAQLAELISELRQSGQTMKLFDAAIAATVLARGDELLTMDDDFERLKHRFTILRFPAA
jgi:predicted nucleic acid-binding protein